MMKDEVFQTVCIILATFWCFATFDIPDFTVQLCPKRLNAGLEEQLWPIACATAVLMGVLTIVIWVCGDFQDERLCTTYTQLRLWRCSAAIIYVGSKIKGRAGRRVGDPAPACAHTASSISAFISSWLFIPAPAITGT